MGARRGRQEWLGDDFVDTDAQPSLFIEQDPWESGEALSPAAGDSLDEPTDPEQAPDDLIDFGDQPSPYDFVDDESRAGDLGEIDWSEEADQTDETQSGWDEPEPTVDAVSDLSESLYPPDHTVTNLSLELMVGELLMRVESITEEQHVQCLELLKACGARRLRHMLPWLRDRRWQGAHLRLFLDFRNHWESSANVRWWEIFLWSEYERCWMPRYQRGALTLDHVRQLTLKRSNCAVHDVIDDAWFQEWDAYAPWELGIRSFADFALFRAGVPGQDDWREYLVREDRRDALEVAQCLDPTFVPFMLPSIVEQYGLQALLFVETDPWPRATELAHERAAREGGDLVRGWQDVLSGGADV